MIELLNLIKDNLANVFKEEEIYQTAANNEFKIIFSNYKYYIEICYNMFDEYYKIRYEDKINQQIYFLTQSKTYHKLVKKYLRKQKLKKRNFENHIIIFIQILKDDIFNKKLKYSRNLKFDGICI